jgi:hypothetical protein
VPKPLCPAAATLAPIIEGVLRSKNHSSSVNVSLNDISSSHEKAVVRIKTKIFY